MWIHSPASPCLQFLVKHMFLSLLKGSVADPDPDPDPHLKSPPGSGSTWTDADLDPGGKKA